MFRIVGIVVFVAAEDSSTRRASSQNKEIHFVTNWHTEISAEQREIKKAVSSLVHAIARSGMSSTTSVNS